MGLTITLVHLKFKMFLFNFYLSVRNTLIKIFIIDILLYYYY